MELYITLGSGQPNGPGWFKVIGPNMVACRGAAYQLTAGRFAFSYEEEDFEKAIYNWEHVQPYRCTIEAGMDETKPFVSRILDVAESCVISAFEGWEIEMIELIKES